MAANKLTARGVSRIEEVIATFVRHGLDLQALEHVGWRFRVQWIARRLSGKEPALTPWPIAIRDALIELGPAFVKIGQILSVRSDLIPIELAEALRTLQEDVPTIPFEEVRRAVEHELGVPLEAAFLSFNEQPLAAGSIAQVHAAVQANGRHVAVKVKRPGIDAQIASDMEVVRWLADRLERFSPSARRFHPGDAAKEIARYTTRELDFRIEADVATRVREFFEDWEDVCVPQVILARSGLLIMEYLDTFPITDLVALTQHKIDRERITRVAINAVLAQIYDLGIFHGDPHPGNLRVTSTGCLAFLDFGIAGELSERLKHCMLSSAIHAARGEIEESLVYMLELAAPQENADPVTFRRELTSRFNAWRNSSAQEYGFGQLVYDQITLGAQYGFVFPPDAVLFTKSLMTLDGVALEVAPDVFMSREAVPYFEKLARRKYSLDQLASRLAWALPRWVDLMEHAPSAGLRRLDRWLADEGQPPARNHRHGMAPAMFGGFVMMTGAVLMVGNVPPAWHGTSVWGLAFTLTGLVLGGQALRTP